MSDDLPVKREPERPLKHFTKIKNLTGWRRVAIGMWGNATSPTVYGQQLMAVSKVRELIRTVREEHDVKISPVHVFVKCVGDVFRTFPDYNVMIKRRQFFRRNSADVFMQVAIHEGGGDLGGIKIQAVDKKTIVDIGHEVAERAERVRARKDQDLEKAKKSMGNIPGLLMPLAVRLTDIIGNDLGVNLSFLGVKPDSWGGAMVTNVGSLGLPHGYAPLVAASRVPVIFLMGAIGDHPVVENKEVVAREMLMLTGTFDHRVFDGLQIAKLYNHVKKRFEDPSWMLDEL